MGVSPHVWGEVLPWLNIFATLAIYILIWVAYKFFKTNLYPDEQDEVSDLVLVQFLIVFSISTDKWKRRRQLKSNSMNMERRPSRARDQHEAEHKRNRVLHFQLLTGKNRVN